MQNTGHPSSRNAWVASEQAVSVVPNVGSKPRQSLTSVPDESTWKASEVMTSRLSVAGPDVFLCPAQSEGVDGDVDMQSFDTLPDMEEDHFTVSYPVTPHHQKGRFQRGYSIESTAYLQEARRARRARKQLARAVFHGAVLLALGLADMTFALHFSIEHHHDPDTAFVLGCVLAGLYGLLGCWLVASCLVPAAWEVAGLRQSVLWLVLALMHISVAYVGCYWREAVFPASTLQGMEAVHAATMASMLQLLLVVLYPLDSVVCFMTTIVSTCTLIALEASVRRFTWTLTDNILLLIVTGVTCVATCSRVLASRHDTASHTLLSHILLPIVNEQESTEPVSGLSTRAGQLTGKLRRAKERLLNCELDAETKTLMDYVFAYLLTELSDLGSLDKIAVTDLQELPPETVDYLTKTLGQKLESEAVDVEGSPKLSEIGSDVNLAGAELTASRNFALLGTPLGTVEELRTGTFATAEPNKRNGERSSTSPNVPHNSTLWVRGTTAPPEMVARQLEIQRQRELGGDSPHADGSLAALDLQHTNEPMATLPNSLLGVQDDEPIEEHDKVNNSKESSVCEVLRDPSFNENINTLMGALCRGDPPQDLPPPQLADGISKALLQYLGQWRFDVFKLARYVGNRPLVVVGGIALNPIVKILNLEAAAVRRFLDNIEARYMENAYHNAMHGADVMNNMLYFLRLQNTALATLEPIEHLAALTAAAAHDVGHNGFANNFHRAAETPLTLLFNDQSPLENMHCTITFTVLRSSGSNFIADLEASQKSVFRGYVTQMILETDLAKHIQTLSRFRKDLLREGFSASDQHTSAERKEFATFALKCSDVAHSTKHFDLHVLWTLSINDEFFRQGDQERQLGLSCSPFCDRTSTKVAQSQCGFFDFIVTPLYKAMGEHLNNKRYSAEVLPSMERNMAFWKHYDGSGFDYNDPVSNASMLRRCYKSWLDERQSSCDFGNSEELQERVDVAATPHSGPRTYSAAS